MFVQNAKKNIQIKQLKDSMLYLIHSTKNNMSKYHKGLTKEQIKLVEKLADIEHIRWSDWQVYLHDQCTFDLDGSLRIPRYLVKRWTQQIQTDYKDLTNREKDSDREQVMRYFDLIK